MKNLVETFWVIQNKISGKFIEQFIDDYSSDYYEQDFPSEATEEEFSRFILNLKGGDLSIRFIGNKNPDDYDFFQVEVSYKRIS